jgi:DNA-binding transcriptional ArsR family regulator
MTDELWVEGPDDLVGAAPPRRPRVTTNASRHIGCPLSWFRLVFPVVRGKNELAVALYIYRLRAIHGSRTVVVTNERLLAELGVNRFAKRRALRRLAEAGIVTLRYRGQSAVGVTFTRRGSKFL